MRNFNFVFIDFARKQKTTFKTISIKEKQLISSSIE